MTINKCMSFTVIRGVILITPSGAYIIRRDSYQYFNPLHIDFHGGLCYTEFNEKECF